MPHSYIALFLIYLRGIAWTRLLLSLFAAIAVFGGAFAGIIFGIGDHALQVTVLGYVAVACNVVMFGSPLASVWLALKSMDPNVIPVLLIIASTACSMTWGFYGYLTANYFILGPNAAGVALCLLQIVIALYVQCIGGAAARGYKKAAGEEGGINSGGPGEDGESSADYVEQE